MDYHRTLGWRSWRDWPPDGASVGDRWRCALGGREKIDEARWMMDRSFWIVTFKVEKLFTKHCFVLYKISCFYKNDVAKWTKMCCDVMKRFTKLIRLEHSLFTLTPKSVLQITFSNFNHCWRHRKIFHNIEFSRSKSCRNNTGWASFKRFHCVTYHW